MQQRTHHRTQPRSGADTHPDVSVNPVSLQVKRSFRWEGSFSVVTVPCAYIDGEEEATIVHGGGSSCGFQKPSLVTLQSHA